MLTNLSYYFSGECISVTDLHHSEWSNLKIQINRQHNFNRRTTGRCTRVSLTFICKKTIYNISIEIRSCSQRKMEQMPTTGSTGEFWASLGRRTRRSRGERIFVWEISKFFEQMEINSLLLLDNDKKDITGANDSKRYFMYNIILQERVSFDE